MSFILHCLIYVYYVKVLDTLYLDAAKTQMLLNLDRDHAYLLVRWLRSQINKLEPLDRTPGKDVVNNAELICDKGGDVVTNISGLLNNAEVNMHPLANDSSVIANVHNEVQNPLSHFLNPDMESTPYIVGEFAGCNVVLDDDQILEEARACLEQQDDLENFDACNHGDDNAFAVLNDCENNDLEAFDQEEQILKSLGKSSNKKKRNRGSPSTVDSSRQVIALSSSSLPPLAPVNCKQKTDKEGFSPIISKRSLRQAGKSFSSSQ